MTLLITGAGQALADLAIAHCAGNHLVRFAESEGAIDWCDPEVVEEQVKDADVVLHLATFDPPACEGDTIDHAARSTYILFEAARNAGVKRVILASTMRLFEAYPVNYVIDETWQPQPRAVAEALIPYLVEIIGREFARQGGISVVCLRFGELKKEEGTSKADALAFIDGALDLESDPLGYRWHVFHCYSGARFPSGTARAVLGLEGA